MTAFAKFAGDLGKSFLGSAAESGGSGLAGALFGGITASRQWKYQQKAMALQQKYALEQMSTQNQYNIDQFNRENAYNDPSAASARWRSAGISPMAVYGSSTGGAGVAGGSGSTPSASGPTASGPDGHAQFGPSMTLAEAAQVRNQNNLTDAEVTLKKSQAREANARAVDQEWKNTLQPKYEAQLVQAIRGVQNDNVRKEIENAYLPLEKAYKLSLDDANRKLMLKQVDLFEANIKDLEARKLLSEAQAAHAREEIADLRATRGARVRSLNSQADYNDALKASEDALRGVRKSEIKNRAQQIAEDIVNEKLVSGVTAAKLAREIAAIDDPTSIPALIWRMSLTTTGAYSDAGDFAASLSKILERRLGTKPLEVVEE